MWPSDFDPLRERRASHRHGWARRGKGPQPTTPHEAGAEKGPTPAAATGPHCGARPRPPAQVLRRASRRWAPARRSFASMSDVPSPRDIMRPFEDAARHVAPWIAHLARVGYVADAVLYGTIGFLAAEAAIRRGGETTDAGGALNAILHAPMG